MNMNHWYKERLPKIAAELERTILSGVHIQTEEGLNLSGRNEMYLLLEDILALLFPGVYSKERVERDDLNFFLDDLLRHISFKSKKVVKEVFDFHCEQKKKDPCKNCDCNEHAQRVCMEFISSLPIIREKLIKDIDAALAGDPAAHSKDEIVLSYPGIEAITIYRLAHRLYELQIPLIQRIISEHAHSKTGIDIHPGATIGDYFFIDHGTGIVIGETTIIGNNVKIYQGVTLGALSPFDKEGQPRKGEKRHPDIEDDVIIYANATILGGKTCIGKGSIIGGNTWITKSVPPQSIILANQKDYSH